MFFAWSGSAGPPPLMVGTPSPPCLVALPTLRFGVAWWGFGSAWSGSPPPCGVVWFAIWVHLGCVASSSLVQRLGLLGGASPPRGL